MVALAVHRPRRNSTPRSPTPTVPPQHPPVPPQTNEPPYEISNPGYILVKSLVSPTRPRGRCGRGRGLRHHHHQHRRRRAGHRAAHRHLGRGLPAATGPPASPPDSILPGSLELERPRLASRRPPRTRVRITMTALASTAAPELNTAITAPTVPPERPAGAAADQRAALRDLRSGCTCSPSPSSPRPAAPRPSRRGPVVFDIVVESTTRRRRTDHRAADRQLGRDLPAQSISASVAPDTAAPGAAHLDRPRQPAPDRRRPHRPGDHGGHRLDPRTRNCNTAVTAPTVPPEHPPVPPQTNEPPYEVSNPGYLLVKSLVSPARSQAPLWARTWSSTSPSPTPATSSWSPCR